LLYYLGGDAQLQQSNALAFRTIALELELGGVSYSVCVDANLWFAFECID